MIAPNKRARILELLRTTGMSHREIGEEVRVSGTTVQRIRQQNGITRPPLDETRRKSTAAKSSEFPSLEKPPSRDHIEPVNTPPVHCEGCGGLIVKAPCIACSVSPERIRKVGEKHRAEVQTSGAIDYDLDDKQWRRLGQMQEKKLAELR